MRHGWGRLLPGSMHWPTLLAGLREAGSWTELLRTWGKETQEISTPLHQFSHIPIKLHPTMRNNFPPGSDPRMLQGWTPRFPHHKIIQVLTGRWLASGTRSQNLQRAWRMVLMTLPSAASHFWHPSRVCVQRLFYQTGPADAMGLAKFQSLFLTSSRKLSTSVHEGHGDYGRTSSWFIKLVQT